MAETKEVKKTKRLAPAVDRGILDLDLDTEDVPEPESDPYAGRLFGNQLDYELDDSDFDRLGGHGLFDF